MKCNSSLTNRLWAACSQLPKSTTLEQVKFIHCYPHFYTRRVKEAIHLRLHPHDIKREPRAESKSQKPGCWQSKTTTAGEQCSNGSQREPDLKDVPITAMEFHPITVDWTVSFISFSLLGSLSHRKSPRLILNETDALLFGLKINHW